MVKNKKISILEIAAWVAAVVFLVTFALAGAGIISASSLLYQIVNFVSASITVAISVKHKVKQTAAVNAVWAAISLVSIIRILMK